MSRKTVKVTFELLGEDGEVQCTSETEWKDLWPVQVLSIEKHVLGGILALNAEATEFALAEEAKTMGKKTF